MINLNKMKTRIIMEDGNYILTEEDYLDVLSKMSNDDKFYKIDDYLTINKDKILLIEKVYNRHRLRDYDSELELEHRHFYEEGIYGRY